MTDHCRAAETLLSDDLGDCAYTCPHSGCLHEMASLARALVHATLAAAPPPWLRCVDQLHGTGNYELNPAHVILTEHRKDGWTWAVDVTGRSHRIASDEDGGQPCPS